MFDLLYVVDENDQIVGQASYEDCHTKGLRHRSSSVFVFKDGSLKEILILKRTPHIVEPDKLCTVGGHMVVGEDYFKAAKKELQEEIFWKHKLPKNIELKEVGKIFYNDMPNSYEFDTIYYVTYPGPFYANPEEVADDLHFVPIEKLILEVKTNPEKFTVAFLKQFEKLVSYFDFEIFK